MVQRCFSIWALGPLYNSVKGEGFSFSVSYILLQLRPIKMLGQKKALDLQVPLDKKELNSLLIYIPFKIRAAIATYPLKSLTSFCFQNAGEGSGCDRFKL